MYTAVHLKCQLNSLRFSLSSQELAAVVESEQLTLPLLCSTMLPVESGQLINHPLMNELLNDLSFSL